MPRHKDPQREPRLLLWPLGKCRWEVEPGSVFSQHLLRSVRCGNTWGSNSSLWVRVTIIFIFGFSDTRSPFIISFPSTLFMHFCLSFYPWSCDLTCRLGEVEPSPILPAVSSWLQTRNNISSPKYSPAYFQFRGEIPLFGTKWIYGTVPFFSNLNIYSSCHERMRTCDRSWTKLVGPLKIGTWGTVEFMLFALL